MSKQDADNRGNSTHLLTLPNALVTSRGPNDHIDTGIPRDNGLPRLNEKQLAERWGVSIRTLQAARVKGGGVPFVRIGRSVRYRLEDVLAYEHARLRAPTPPRHFNERGASR